MVRRSCLGGAAVLTVMLVVLLGSCARSGPEVDENAPLTVETSSMWVTVGNRAGMPVTDMTIEIIPMGGATVYSTNYYRLEDDNEHNFPLNEFRGRDGTPFNLRVVRPKAVRVTCKGVDGKPRSVEVPWR